MNKVLDYKAFNVKMVHILKGLWFKPLSSYFYAIGRFYTTDELSVWTNYANSIFVRLILGLTNFQYKSGQHTDYPSEHVVRPNRRIIRRKF